ncbi:MAG TPA: hypothetical protein VFQ61_01730, partial [Polyangiaceae bacterium]|nr:hypothetical protein [Polyangiaceae bacterium]
CDVAWDRGGAAFIAGTICAPGVSYYSGILRRDPDGKLTHIAGNTASNGSTSEGVPATLAYLSSYHSLAFDPAGNLYVSQPGEAKVRRIEGASGRITTVVGTGASAFGGEYASAASAALNNPQGLSSDPSGNLYVVDTNNLSVRQVYRGANTIPSTATLSLQSGDTQTATMGAMLGAFSAKLVDGSAAPLKGFNVAWRAVDFGAGLYAPSSTTGVTGIATATARTGLSPGAYRYEASFRDIHGQHVSGSPVLFSATASTPTSGTIFTLVNINTAESYAGVPGPGPFAGISRPRDVAAGSDGTLYFVAGCAVYRLSKVGHLEIIAGGDLCGFAGETGPALSAKFYAPGALALDEKNGLIYVSDTYNHRVRVVNLADSTIETFAGGGTAIGPNFGDGGPATAASLNMPGHIAVDADGNVYFDDVNNDRLRRVDKATRIISRWVSYITCNGTNTGLASCGSSGNGCDIAFDSNGNAYISSGYMCAPGVNSQFGVVKRAGNGTFTHVAGGTLAWTEGMLATKASLVNLTNIALDSANNLYISQGGSNLLRRIDLSSGKIFSAAGDGAGGYAEYVPAVSARVNYPLGLAAHPNGGVVFADYNNFAFRRIY